MRKTPKPILLLLKPFLAIAAVLLFILDAMHVNINSLMAFTIKGENT